MAASACFELACETLERNTSLDRLEARGTIRLALKSAGLEAGSVTPHQLSVVAESLLPTELAARGVENAEEVCNALRQALAPLDAPEDGDTPEAVFARLGGS